MRGGYVQMRAEREAVSRICYTCKMCGNDFFEYASSNERIYCSRKCAHKIKRIRNWKGGEANSRGYKMIYSPDHPSKTRGKYVLEHRLVMEAHLGRTLNPTEVVHHINHIVDDNRIENLMLFANNNLHLNYHRWKDDLKSEDLK